MKLVSAIITTHNRVDYLKKAVESIMNQTYKDIEIIIVDDCSTDSTREYCESLENIKYIYISKEEHKNGNYARNLGIKNSKGEYIAFLDDDDEWFPTKIEKQVNEIEKDEKYGVVYAGRTFEVNDGLYLYENKIKPELIGDLSKKIFIDNLSTTSVFLFKKSVLEDVGMFDEKVNFWQETELMMRICQKYQVAAIDESLVLYRQNFNDKKRLTNKVNGFINAIDYINNKHKEEIEKLPFNMRKKRKGMIYADIANRYSVEHKYFMSRIYLIKHFVMCPGIKNFIAIIINYTNYKHMKRQIAKVKRNHK